MTDPDNIQNVTTEMSLNDADKRDREALLGLTDLHRIIDFIREHLDEDEVCRFLDEHVHEGKAHEAEVINNQGLEVQARYLAHFSVPQFAKDIADEYFPQHDGC
jgi:hypothetical protein